MRILIAICAMFGLFACTEAVPTSGNARILAMGDSMFAFHGGARQSVSDHLERALEQEVIDRSVTGARYLYPLPISGRLGLRIGHQYVPADWDWVVMNGGGNDLWLGCGCALCDGQLDRLISADGTSGEIVDTVARIRAGGARVVYAGYLRTPGFPSPIEHCAAYGTTLEARLDRMAARDAGVTFVSMADLVPPGDRSFHESDRIHPSHKGSAAIAARIATVIAPRP